MNHLNTTTLNLYLDGILDRHACAQVDAHLATCPPCQRELFALRALAASFDAWRAEPIPRDLSATVMTRIATRPAPALVSRWGAALLGVQVVFAILILTWLAPMVLRGASGLPLELVPTFDFSGVTNLLETMLAVSLPFPSFAPAIWIAGLVGIALMWLVGNRLLFQSLDHSFNPTQEASQ